MRKNKTEKGITLVALIITIVVLLILSAVAIAAIQNNRIMEQAQSGADKYSEASEEEQITLALNEWTLKKYTEPGTIFAQFMISKFGTDKVTVYGENEVTVRLESGKEYEAKADGTVEESILIGSYVEYDVSYEDVYQGTTFNSKNGWRYLGKEARTGNYLLISTGIPIILYCDYNTSGENAKWWDANTRLNANVRATNGMINNFAKIPYTQTASGTSVSTANTAIGRFAGTEVTVDGTTYTAIGDAFKSNTYAGNIKNVRTLTLAELNRAVNGASGSNRGDFETKQGFKEIPEGNTAYGLFDMKDLSGYTANFEYLLLDAPYNGITVVSYALGSVADYGNSGSLGVRPVVELQSDVELMDTDGDGVLEIQ